MPILTITFPGHRYHATAWGTHVNEGQVEWPPSPWRILRAMLSVGMTKLGWRDDDIPRAAGELVSTLASTLPVYTLPPARTVAHTRHYMPIPGNTSKVLDTFVHVGDQTLRVGWDVALTPDVLDLFRQLTSHMNYLGRAESWVNVDLAVGPLDAANCRPCADPVLADDVDPVSLLAPLPPDEFTAWRAAHATPTSTRGRSSAPVVPETLLSAMMCTSDRLQRDGWSLPPGTRRVLYTRPRDALVAAQPRIAPRSVSRRDPVECVLLALGSSARNFDVVPPLHRVLPQMEQLHRALARQLDGHACPEITGHDEQGRPMQGHRHAHYVPLSLRDRRGCIDHILVVAPTALTDVAQRALEALPWIHTAGAAPQDADLRARLTTVLAARGSLVDLRAAIRGRDTADLLGESACWISHTPFIAPRHIKPRHTIADQVTAELRSRGLPEPRRVDVAPPEHAADAGFVRFARTRRRSKPQPPRSQPWLVRLEFDRPIRGPIALGYAAHFGLGLFRPHPP